MCLVLAPGCAHEAMRPELPDYSVELQFTVGEGVTDTSVVFGMVGDAGILADRSVLVVDAMTPSVQWFDPDGVWRRQIGRSGSGPGEYRTPSDVAVLDDGRIVVWDPGNARLNLYRTDGSPLESVTVPTNMLSATRSLFVDHADRAYIRIMPRDADAGDFALLRVDLGTGAVDTVRSRWRATPAPLVGDPRWQITVPFAPTLSWSVRRDGGFIVSQRAEYAVLITDSAGNETGSISQPYTPVAVEPGEADAYRDAITSVQRRREPGWRWSGADIPSTKPAIRSIAATADGRILVQPHVQAVERPRDPDRNRVNWTEPQVYHLYEADGTSVGAFRLPERTVLIRVRGDRVLARRERPNGEVVVDQYRLVLRQAPCSAADTIPC